MGDCCDNPTFPDDAWFTAELSLGLDMPKELSKDATLAAWIAVYDPLRQRVAEAKARVFQQEKGLLVSKPVKLTFRPDQELLKQLAGSGEMTFSFALWLRPDKPEDLKPLLGQPIGVGTTVWLLRTEGKPPQ